MSVLAISTCLTWTHNNRAEISVKQRVIAKMKNTLFYHWSYEESGPKLEEEILASILSNEIIDDMNALQALGAVGIITFGVSHSRFPIVKCVISVIGLTWLGGKIPLPGTEEMFIRIDPITEEEVQV